MLFETSYFTYSPFGAPLPGRTYNAMEELNKVEIANQEFASGVDGWSTANSNTTVSNDAGRLKLLTTNTSVVSMQKNYVTTSGKHYRISFDADAASYTNVSVDIVGYGSTVLSSAILNTGVTHYELDFVANDASTVIRVSLGTGTGTRTIYLDNVKLEEIKGDIDGFAFGFGGQERDNEMCGEGNSYTAEYWEYDARLARRWNVDPKPKPFISGYAVLNNNPIIFIDPYGDEVINGDALKAKEAKDVHAARSETRQLLMQDYGITENMKKKDFKKAGGTGQQWKEYKKITKEVNRLAKDIIGLDARAAITQDIIDRWKGQSQSTFDEVNNQAVDFILISDDLSRESYFGQNYIFSNDNGLVFDPFGFGFYPKPALTIVIDQTVNISTIDSRTNQYSLNHEAGHFLYIVQHPQEYFQYPQKLKSQNRDSNGGHNDDDASGVKAKEYGSRK